MGALSTVDLAAIWRRSCMQEFQVQAPYHGTNYMKSSVFFSSKSLAISTALAILAMSGFQSAATAAVAIPGLANTGVDAGADDVDDNYVITASNVPAQAPTPAPAYVYSD